MRYRFRGLARDTGRPVDGHVEADNQQAALDALSDYGIVTEGIAPDPRAAGPAPEPGGRPQLIDAIDSAVDTSSTQVPFDALTEKFKGKSVWVIDREKIRSRVAQVVDQVLAQNPSGSTDDPETRRRVAEAIDGLFRDNRNLTSKASAANEVLERQILRLGNFVSKAENLLASMSATIRNLSLQGVGGGGGYLPRRARTAAYKEEQNQVLAEIFKANVELLQQLETQAFGMAADAAGAEPPLASATPEPSGRQLPTPQPKQPAGKSGNHAGTKSTKNTKKE